MNFEKKSSLFMNFLVFGSIIEDSLRAENQFFYLKVFILLPLVLYHPGWPHPPPPPVAVASLFSYVMSPETWQMFMDGGMEITSKKSRRLFRPKEWRFLPDRTEGMHYEIRTAGLQSEIRNQYLQTRSYQTIPAQAYRLFKFSGILSRHLFRALTAVRKY
jgi:hypothetical protein